MPLVGVGLAYAEGYFRQVLNADGWQGESYRPTTGTACRSCRCWRARAANAWSSACNIPTASCSRRLWKVQVLPFDANVEENAPPDRSITGPLYGGDQEFRVRQEIMLGIGGTHAPRPSACRRRCAT